MRRNLSYRCKVDTWAVIVIYFSIILHWLMSIWSNSANWNLLLLLNLHVFPIFMLQTLNSKILYQCRISGSTKRRRLISSALRQNSNSVVILIFIYRNIDFIRDANFILLGIILYRVVCFMESFCFILHITCKIVNKSGLAFCFNQIKNVFYHFLFSSLARKYIWSSV